jgi:L-fuculose-phosphate aldolase
VHEFVKNDMKSVALSMFRKNFFGIFHGSISARVEQDQFIINKKNAIFDNLDKNDFIKLYSKKDYRWNEASLDSDIHLNIYKNISEAKFITYAMPPFVTAYSIKHKSIKPIDYFGYKRIKEIEIFDPKQFEDWYERAEFEIYNHLKNNKTNIIIIKGYGIYMFERDLQQIAKTIAILENSCKILHYM